MKHPEKDRERRPPPALHEERRQRAMPMRTKHPARPARNGGDAGAAKYSAPALHGAGGEDHAGEG